MGDALPFVHDVHDLDAAQAPQVVRLAARRGIERRAVEVDPPAAVVAAGDASPESGEIGVGVIQALGHRPSGIAGLSPARQRTQCSGAPKAIMTRCTREPCRWRAQRMRRHFSQTPPLLIGKGRLHSSHSVLKIELR